MGETEERDNKTSRINENNIHNTNINAVYHAVYIPTDVKDNTEGPAGHVYIDKQEALNVIKTFRNGRLKTFKSLLEAEKFAKHGYEDCNNSINKIPRIQIINAEEKSSSFKGPKPQELVCFRKLIENGDVASVVKMAWENPRYLISSGDTPAILQEGCRYNALHIASFKCSNDVKMTETILEIVGNPKFVELLYGKGDKHTCSTTAKIWLDLYLNTPDKGLNETPLHFAAKFGRKEVVKILLSYPQCLKTVKNKFDQTPLQVVCSRKGQEDEKLAKEILMLLEDQYYVPVLRAEDNSLQPIIGQPFSPSSPPTINIDPLSPRVEVKAIAGPMTKPQAVEFRRKWKTPPRITNKTPNKNEKLINNDTFNFSTPRGPRDLGLRLQDTEKGLESVGRELAEEHHVPWKEFWPFLNNFTDLRCIEGLFTLEKYLKKRSSAIIPISINEKKENATGSGGSRRRLVEETEDKNSKALFTAITHGESDYIDVLIQQLKMCSLDRNNDGDNDNHDSHIDEEKFETPPETPNESDTESDDNDYSLAEEDAFVVDNIFIDGELPGKNDLAVLNAIPDVIDAEIYPYIYRWKHEVILAKRRNHIICCSTSRRRLLLTPEK